MRLAFHLRYFWRFLFMGTFLSQLTCCLASCIDSPSLHFTAPKTVTAIKEVDYYIEHIENWKREEEWQPIIDYGEKALKKINEQLGATEPLMISKSQIHADLTSIYFYRGQFNEALEHAKTCFASATLTHNLNEQLKSLYLMSASYRALAEKIADSKVATRYYHKAVSYCEDALDLMENSEVNDFFKAKVWFNYGAAHADAPDGDLSKATLAFEESIRLLKVSDTPDDMARSYIRLANAYLKLKDFKEIEKVFLKAEPLVRKERTLMHLEYAKARYFLEIGKIELAYQTAKSTKQRAEKLEARQDRERATKLLLTIEQKLKLNRKFIQDNLFLIQPNGKLHPSLLDLAKLMAVKNDGTVSSFIEATQKQWLRGERKRWQIKDTLTRDDPLFQKALSYLDQLGSLQAKMPHQTHYDYALLTGATLPTAKDKLEFLSSLCEKGIHFKAIVVVASNRNLYPEIESPAHFAKILASKIIPTCQTEIEMMQALYHHLSLSEKMKDTPIFWVSAPMKQLSNGKITRASSEDLFREWLKSNPEPGSCLAISKQPYVYSLNAFLRRILPRQFSLETVGNAASKDLPLGVHLDNVARWIYSERELLEQSSETLNAPRS